MEKGRNPYILDLVKEEIGSLIESFSELSSSSAIHDIGRLIKELDAFVTVDDVTGNKELSLADVLADAREDDNAKTRGYVIGEISGYEYHVLTLGAVQSFASFVEGTLVVLWFGSSRMKSKEQEQAKEIAVSRLLNYLEEVE